SGAAVPTGFAGTAAVDAVSPAGAAAGAVAAAARTISGWIGTATAGGVAAAEAASIAAAAASFVLLWSASLFSVVLPSAALVVPVSAPEPDVLSEAAAVLDAESVLSVGTGEELPLLSAVSCGLVEDLVWSDGLLRGGSRVWLGPGAPARGAGAVDVSGGVAASTSAEKLSERGEGSARDGFGAAVLRAVLAWMSDVTLNTLEPLAMNSTQR